MNVIEIDKTNIFPTIETWCIGHDFPILDKSLLSDTMYVNINEQDVATHMVSFYKTNSEIAWLGFPISNPYINKESKQGGLQTLIKEIIKKNKDKYTHIFTTSSNRKLIYKLECLGFMQGDIGVNHYLLNIKNI